MVVVGAEQIGHPRDVLLVLGAEDHTGVVMHCHLAGDGRAGDGRPLALVRQFAEFLANDVGQDVQGAVLVGRTKLPEDHLQQVRLGDRVDRADDAEVLGVGTTDANWLDTVKAKLGDWNEAINARFVKAEGKLKEGLMKYYGLTEEELK